MRDFLQRLVEGRGSEDPDDQDHQRHGNADEHRHTNRSALAEEEANQKSDKGSTRPAPRMDEADRKMVKKMGINGTNKITAATVSKAGFSIVTDLGEEEPNQGPNDKPPKRHWEATRKERFLDLKFSHYVEILLTLALVGIAYLQYTVYDRQAGIMDAQTKISSRQLNAMEIDKRPWIRATVSMRELSFSEWDGKKSIFAGLTFDLKNYGESPAVNILISTFVYSHPGNSESAKLKLDTNQKAMCEQARSQGAANPIGGPTIFPTESSTIQSGAGGGTENLDMPTIFSVNGCIVYSYGENRTGETGFRMIVGRIVKNRIVGIPFVEGTSRPYDEPISPDLLASGYPAAPPKVAIIPPSDFTFRPDGSGGNYAK